MCKYTSSVAEYQRVRDLKPRGKSCSSTGTGRIQHHEPVEDETVVSVLLEDWQLTTEIDNAFSPDKAVEIGLLTVKVVLASGFVGEANEALLSPTPSGKITFTGKGQAGESKNYLYRGFMKFFYVREPVVAPENSEVLSS